VIHQSTVGGSSRSSHADRLTAHAPDVKESVPDTFSMRDRQFLSIFAPIEGDRRAYRKEGGAEGDSRAPGPPRKRVCPPFLLPSWASK
jgi:hypothetical protein